MRIQLFDLGLGSYGSDSANEVYTQLKIHQTQIAISDERIYCFRFTINHLAVVQVFGV